MTDDEVGHPGAAVGLLAGVVQVVAAGVDAGLVGVRGGQEGPFSLVEPQVGGWAAEVMGVPNIPPQLGVCCYSGRDFGMSAGFRSASATW